MQGLVEALQGMLKLWEKVGGDGEHYYVKQAKAAIAAAKVEL